MNIGVNQSIKNQNILMKQKTSQDTKGQMTANTWPNKQTKSKYTENLDKSVWLKSLLKIFTLEASTTIDGNEFQISQTWLTKNTYLHSQQTDTWTIYVCDPEEYPVFYNRSVSGSSYRHQIPTDRVPAVAMIGWHVARLLCCGLQAQ